MQLYFTDLFAVTSLPLILTWELFSEAVSAQWQRTWSFWGIVNSHVFVGTVTTPCAFFKNSLQWLLFLGTQWVYFLIWVIFTFFKPGKGKTWLMFCLELDLVIKEWEVVEITTRRTDEEAEEEAELQLDCRNLIGWGHGNLWLLYGNHAHCLHLMSVNKISVDWFVGLPSLSCLSVLQ